MTFGSDIQVFALSAAFFSEQIEGYKGCWSAFESVNNLQSIFGVKANKPEIFQLVLLSRHIVRVCAVHRCTNICHK